MDDQTLPVVWEGIGLDGQASGIAIHAQNLKKELNRIGVFPVILPARPTSDTVPQSLQKILRSKVVRPLISFQTWRNSYKSSAPYIFHGLANLNLPILGSRSRARFVLTVHDLIPLLAPNDVSRIFYLQFQALLPKALRRADAVICVSEWTRTCLLDRFPWAEPKVFVIPNGTGDLGDGEDFLSIEKGHHTKTELVCVSRYEGYKNLDLLPGIIHALGPEYRLTLVTDRQAPFQKEPWTKLYADGQLRILVNLGREEILEVYRNCDVYVHPSRYEGFCLPAAEALSLGKPVVYMGGSGIDETVVGDISFRINPNEPLSQWVDSILAATKLRFSPDLQSAWQHFLQSRPSWSAAAQRVKTLYNEII